MKSNEFSTSTDTRLIDMPTPEFPVERPKPDHKKYHNIPKIEPGQTAMVCPTENTLTAWDFLPDEMLQCTKCGRRISRKEATS